MRVVRIRRGQDDRVERMRQIRNDSCAFMTRYQQPISEPEQSVWWQGLDHRKCRCFLAWEGDTAIGYGLIATEDGKSWLTGAIRPEDRGKGYGRALFRRLIHLAPAQPWLEVLETNERAHRLYRDLGFQEVQRCHGVITMALPVAPPLAAALDR